MQICSWPKTSYFLIHKRNMYWTLSACMHCQNIIHPNDKKIRKGLKNWHGIIQSFFLYSFLTTHKKEFSNLHQKNNKSKMICIFPEDDEKITCLCVNVCYTKEMKFKLTLYFFYLFVLFNNFHSLCFLLQFLFSRSFAVVIIIISIIVTHKKFYK